MPGPVPKQADERIRRNADVVPTEKIEAFGAVIVPPLNLPFEVHPMAQDFYKSLALSAYSKYYEPSDWEYARLATFIMHGIVSSGKPSSEMYKALQTAMSNLLVTEGDRRRLRIEIAREAEKPKVDDEMAKVVDMFQDRMRRAEEAKAQ